MLLDNCLKKFNRILNVLVTTDGQKFDLKTTQTVNPFDVLQEQKEMSTIQCYVCIRDNKRSKFRSSKTLKMSSSIHPSYYVVHKPQQNWCQLFLPRKTWVESGDKYFQRSFSVSFLISRLFFIFVFLLSFKCRDCRLTIFWCVFALPKKNFCPIARVEKKNLYRLHCV